MERRRAICRFICLLAFCGSASFAFADAEIWDPDDGTLAAGSNIQPAGWAAAIYGEQGDILLVDITFRKNASAGGAATTTTEQVWGPDWWCEEDCTVPGGDYIGGIWSVSISVNSQVLDSKTGTIVSPE
jgi:hypothetical protein